MTSINPTMLDDTLKLFSLAKEMAHIRGQAEQAERYTPIVDNLRSLVNDSRETKASTATPVNKQSGNTAKTSDVLGQPDFQTLLKAAQENPKGTQSASKLFTSSSNDRNFVVTAMSNGGTPSIDIARQMGMTTDEVQMILSLNQTNLSVK